MVSESLVRGVDVLKFSLSSLTKRAFREVDCPFWKRGRLRSVLATNSRVRSVVSAGDSSDKAVDEGGSEEYDN